MTMQKEVWKSVPGYEGKYFISSLGWIKSKNNLLAVRNTAQGYYDISLAKKEDGITVRKSFCIHRLVATVFIPNPENKRTVNHKNGNKKDNRVENLEWATDSENNQHAYDELGRIANQQETRKKIVVLTDLDGNKTEHKGIRKLARELSITYQLIQQAAKEKYILLNKYWVEIK